MVVASSYPHIEIDDNDVPRIGKSRYEVLHIAAEHFHYGWSAEELLRQHADLRPEEVYAALTYFYDHYQSILEKMKATSERGESRLQNQTLTRAHLLRRLGKTQD